MNDLARLAADLEGAARDSRWLGLGVVRKAAAAVEKSARAAATGIAHAPHYPESITSDVRADKAGYTAEIGPDKNRRQGALGNILVYGTSKNGPVAPLQPSLEQALPGFVRDLGDVAEDVL